MLDVGSQREFRIGNYQTVIGSWSKKFTALSGQECLLGEVLDAYNQLNIEAVPSGRINRTCIFPRLS